MKKIFTTLVAVALLATSNAQNFQDKQLRIINVNGTAEMEVVPDEIYVQVELREYKKGITKIDIEAIKKNFIKAVIGIGIADTNITVQGYQGYDANYWWYRKNKKKNPDMMASITYWVTLTSTKKMDELVEKLDDEATQNFFIAKVSHSKVQEFKKQLKIQAVKQAKEKATYLAAAIHETIGNAININEPHEMGIYAPMVVRSTAASTQMREMAGGVGGDVSAANIDFKKIKYKFDVNVTFGLK
ncbi:MAG TPA: SIMPL domain-containing protein [Segetibacter sp.]